MPGPGSLRHPMTLQLERSRPILQSLAETGTVGSLWGRSPRASLSAGYERPKAQS